MARGDLRPANIAQLDSIIFARWGFHFLQAATLTNAMIGIQLR